MAIVLIGTLDTKGSEIGFVRQRLTNQGLDTLVIDAGSLGDPQIPADISRADVFAAAGQSLAQIRAQGDRGNAVTFAALGVEKLILDLHAQGRVDGILGLGGSAGTTIATRAMRALPFGIPKLMVSTLASGQVRPFVGPKDILMMHSVVDIAGINRISGTVLSNAAAAIAGMASSPPLPRVSEEPPLLAASMFGVTTPCVERARAQLDKAGYETLVFHAVGTGGQAMESLIADGLIAGVLDVTTTELADELVGGALSAGPDRLTVAARCGIPQVISVGALDMVNFGPRATVPEKFTDRQFYIHNENVTLMRTTPSECAILGEWIGKRAAAATGPVAVMLPLRGVSAIDAQGQPFWSPQADQALFEAIHAHAGAAEVIDLDLHVNDPSFADALVKKLQQLLNA